jgi:hypothetical protein
LIRLRILVLALCLAFIPALAGTLAPAAHADYKAGSSHPLLAKHRRLALPLPRTSALPKLTVTPSGRLRVSATLRYRAANWRGHGKAERDRVTVTFAVARRMLASGPYRGSEVFRKAIRHRLQHREVKRRYSVLLPARASRLLIKWGALSSHPQRRAQALRRITVDVQQDRDYRRVDGRYDWREGGAWSAADALLARLHSRARGTEGRVELSSYRAPTGTLTLINNTASGVYCERGCPLVQQSGEPGTIAGTSNSGTYRVPIAVAGGPVQCFDQGSNGSDPEGFANFNAAGEPQPYVAGELGGPITADDPLPNTTGTAVTEGLAADYTLAWASEDELADETGLISGSVKLGVVVGVEIGKSVAEGAVSFISPGAVITDVLGIFEFFLENSCKEQGNYFNITGAEAKGGTFSQIIEAKNEVWGDYPGTGETPYGTQFNPSLLGYEKTPLRLNPVGAITPGLADNACIDCSANNVVEMSWAGYNPCPDGYNCAGEPPATPIVSNPEAELNCGTGNKRCPFPAAAFPSKPKPVFLGLSNGELLTCNASRVTECSKLDEAGDNYIASLNLDGGRLWSGISNGVIWECLPEVANECSTIGEGGKHTGVNTVVHESSRAYAGYSDGNLFSCIEGTSQGCFTIDSTGGTSINALAVAPNGNLIVGRHDGVIWSCSPTNQNDCTELDRAGSPILSISQGPGNTFYAGIENGTIWECPTNVANACTTLEKAPSGVEAVAYANGRIFAGFSGESDESSYFLGCTPGKVGRCEHWGNGFVQRFATVGERLYTASYRTLSVCSTVTAFTCEELDSTGNSKITIDSIAVTGEEFASQP